MSLTLLADVALLASLTGGDWPKIWYVLPPLVATSLVYGATRHERTDEILAHSLRSAIWLTGFFAIIFAIIWLAGYGTTSDTLTKQMIVFVVCAATWLMAGLLVTLDAFERSSRDGWKCILSGGVYSLVYGFRHGQVLIPTLFMLVALLWAVSNVWGS